MSTSKAQTCCGRTFQNTSALLQHQRDSPKHRTGLIKLPEQLPAPISTAQICCGGRFRTPIALSNHQRAKHQPVQPTNNLDELLGRLSLQDRDANSGFTPFSGANLVLPLPPRSSSENLYLRPIPFVKSGESSSNGRKRKSAAKTTGGFSGWNSRMARTNLNTGRMMDLTQDLDWSVCDKDCGWCGHCMEHVSL